MNEVVAAHVILSVFVLAPSLVLVALVWCSWYAGRLMAKEDKECTPDDAS